MSGVSNIAREEEEDETPKVTSDHIYNRIADVLGSDFDTVKRACELARERGIVVMTYANPDVAAEMLEICGWLGVAEATTL